MDIPFTLRQLEYFVAVLEVGTVTEAARRSNISQSAASVALAQLEKALGAELFLRTQARRLVPTSAGEALGVHARRILAEAHELSDAVRSDWDGVAGRVRVGCMVTMSPRLLPRLVQELQARWPAIELIMVEGAPEDLQNDVAQGRLDLAFIFAQHALSDLETTTIVSARPHALLPQDHPLAAKKAIHLAELVHEDAVLLDVPPSAERVLSMFQTLGLEPRVRWRSSVSETVRELVARGFGYSIMNIWPGTEQPFAASHLALVPLADETPANAVIAVTGSVRQPRRIGAVIDAAIASASTTD